MYYKIAELVLCSEIPLPSFRDFACAAAEADVTLGVTDEAPPPGRDVCSGSFLHRQTPEGWFFRPADGGRMGLFAEREYTRLRLLPDPSRPVGVVEEHLVRLALECRLVYRGCLSLHAACVEVGGKAVAFCAPSGTGKSTRAFAWAAACGAKLVSGDRPLIDVREQAACGVPWDGKEGCFRNVRYPLSAVCEVRRSSRVYARGLTFSQKRRLLLQQCFLPMWDTDAAALQMINVTRMAARGRIVRAFCGPGPGDAAELRRLIDEGEILKEETDMVAKTGFVLRNLVGEYVLMPTGENINRFNGTVLLSEVSAFVWEKLQSPVSREDLLRAILDEYDVEEARAGKDLDDLLERFREYGIIEEQA